MARLSKGTKALIYALIPLAVYLIPRHAILYGRSICLFDNLLGIKCWGCGMTRAIWCLAHLDFGSAWQFNRLVFVVFPLLCALYVRAAVKDIRATGKSDS